MSDVPTTEQEAMQPMDPEAAAELAQELTLVARAMFAQLLPDTATNAVAGISSPVGTAQGAPADASADAGSPASVAAPSAPGVVSPSAPIVSVPLPSLPVPLPVPMLPPTRIPVQTGEAGPIPLSPVVPGAAGTDTEGETDTVEAAPAGSAAKAAPRTMAMLEEITFLDE
jgi:hypothetical protein